MAPFPYCEASFLLGQEEQDSESELEQADDGFWLARNIAQ
jgi:hypothetical protein